MSVKNSSTEFVRRHTWVESVSFDPVASNLSENSASGNRLGTYLLAKLWAATEVKKGLLPFARSNVHEVHSAGVRNFNRRDRTDEERRQE